MAAPQYPQWRAVHPAVRVCSPGQRVVAGVVAETGTGDLVRGPHALRVAAGPVKGVEAPHQLLVLALPPAVLLLLLVLALMPR
jgi:hypothetical protein